MRPPATSLVGSTVCREHRTNSHWQVIILSPTGHAHNPRTLLVSSTAAPGMYVCTAPPPISTIVGNSAFDLRPELTSSGALLMHHGDITVDHNLTAAVSEVVVWANANPDEVSVLPCISLSMHMLLHMQQHTDLTSPACHTLCVSLQGSRLPVRGCRCTHKHWGGRRSGLSVAS